MIIEDGLFSGGYRNYVNHDYIKTVEKAGGIPLVFPVIDDKQDYKKVIDRVDEIGMFLNSLRCENVNRSSYIRFPEMKETEQLKKEAYEELTTRMDILEMEQRQAIENFIEVLEHWAFLGEEQAYCQGYVDCVQLLAGLGMLERNPDIEKLVEKIRR